MDPAVVERLAAAVPRYTSYPTAAQFTNTVGPQQFADGLATLPATSKLSLYVHIPFCAEMCWYCGCSTKVVHKAEPVAQYLDWLETEIITVGAMAAGTHKVTHIHWGGGSPNVLKPDQIRRLADALRHPFTLSETTEFAVEIDPRGLTDEQIAAFAQSGVNRASVGVQDFDPAVQAAINRIQSLELTKRAIDGFRAAGVQGINIDLVYGLPHQTRDSVSRTISDVIALAPDRVALFGYAHMPARSKHQQLIDEKALPGTIERFDQSRSARRLLTEAGYVAVGLDHFAKPTDQLASGTVARNFQGYTTDTADALIGFGASAISKLPAGYFQNTVSRHDYERRIEEFGLATARGVLLTDEDRMRAFVIERLMCDFTFSRSALMQAFGERAAGLLRDGEALLHAPTFKGLIEPTDDGFKLTSRGEPFVRSIAASFDAYYDVAAGKYSAGV